MFLDPQVQRVSSDFFFVKPGESRSECSFPLRLRTEGNEGGSKRYLHVHLFFSPLSLIPFCN